MSIGHTLRRYLIDAQIGMRLLSYNINKKPFPLVTHLLVTNRCNLKCFYCYPQVFTREIVDESLDDWKKTIDKFAEMGTKVFVILGGEPLIRTDIGEIIEYAWSKNTIVELITNGYYVKKRLKHLKYLDSLCFSLDGNEAQNDAVRGKGSFKKVLEAIDLAKKEGINCRIHAVITRETTKSLLELCELAKKLDITINFTQATVHTDDPDATLTDEELVHSLNLLKELKEKGYPVTNSISAIDYIKNYPLKHYGIFKSKDVPIEARDKIKKCRRPYLTNYVDADGTLYPCANLWHKGENSIHDGGIEAAWKRQTEMDCYSCDILGEADMNNLLYMSPKSIATAIGHRWFKRSPSSEQSSSTLAK
ncbi:MAG: radical SAM protein [Pseudomonadota bacterium]|nr:radical SAM protein [Pseudomonadota bacterium]